LRAFVNRDQALSVGASSNPSAIGEIQGPRPGAAPWARLAPFIIFAILALGKYSPTLFYLPAPNDHWPNGDAYDYVPRAQIIWAGWHGQDKASGPNVTSFRPQGYPFVIALLMAFGQDFRAVNMSTCVLNVAADLALCLLLLRLCLSFTRSVPVRCIFAAVLVMQPWTSQYLRLIMPDILTALLTAAGVAALAVFIIARKSSAAIIWLLTGSALLSATFLLRPEMIVFVPFLVCLALLVRRPRWRMFLAYAAIGALPFFASVAVNVAYRLRAEGKVAVFGKFEYERPGLMRWTGTFIASETVKLGVLWY
jgi:hypothetical protein